MSRDKKMKKKLEERYPPADAKRMEEQLKLRNKRKPTNY